MLNNASVFTAAFARNVIVNNASPFATVTPSFEFHEVVITPSDNLVKPKFYTSKPAKFVVTSTNSTALLSNPNVNW